MNAPEKYWSRWAKAGNDHLLAFVLAGLKVSRFYNAEQTHTLVAFKNAWVEDMETDNRGEGISIEAQKEAWNDCMMRAMEAGAVGGPGLLSVPVVRTVEAEKRGLRAWEVWDITAPKAVDPFEAEP